MNVIYPANVRLPTESAHGLQIMKTCEAMARAGLDVELVLPRRNNNTDESPFSFYGVEECFRITWLPVIDFFPAPVPFAFYILGATYFLSLAWYLRKSPRGIWLYARGEVIVPLALFFSKRFHLVWESHIKPGHMERYRSLARRLAGVVTVTQYYRTELVERFDFAASRVLCIPDAVDLEAFAQAPDRVSARTQLGLPTNRTIAVYTGSDIPWKGLTTLRQAALLVPHSYLVAFVGEIAPDGSDPRKLYAGYRPRIQMPLWLSAADVLVLTGTNTSEISQRYTSPLKLFEYLAAGRPIVCSDLSSFREILDERTVYFAKPDDPAALAEAIQRAAEEPDRNRKANAAKELAEQYSWTARGKRIRSFIESLVPGANHAAL